MTQNTAIRNAVIELELAGVDAVHRRSVIEAMYHYETIGEAAFWAIPGGRNNEALHDLNGWPKCACTGCGCDEPATCTDEQSVEVCGVCSEYTIDNDGKVHCANCDDVEIVTESCGAGLQIRSWARLKTPASPAKDPREEGTDL